MQSPASPLVQAWRARQRRLRLLAVLYLPWALAVFLPLQVVTMVLFGTTGALVALVSADAAGRVGQAWGRLMCALNFTRVSLHGVDQVDPGRQYVLMLNHNSHFDVICFYAVWRQQFRFVVKQELKKIPGLGWYCQAGGHVFVDRRDHARAVRSLDAAATRMRREGFSIAFFPEGTRSRDGRLQPLKKGGFVMAEQLGVPILPISISGSSDILPGHALRLLPGRVRITVQPPIDPARYGGDRDRLIADTRAALARGLTPWERGEG